MRPIWRREFIPLLGGLAWASIWPLPGNAQEKAKIPIVGVLWHAENAAGEPNRLEALRAGLAENGWIDGKNIKVIDTFAAEKFERFYTNAESLVNTPVDVLFAHTQPAAVAAARATKTIPIVFTWVPDPVQLGLIQSLSRPGGNLTGLSNVAVDLSGKKLQMLKEFTGSSRLGFLANGNDANMAGRSTELLKIAAAELRIEFYANQVLEPEQIRPAFDEFARQKVGGVITQPDSLFFNERGDIAKLAIERQIGTLGHVEEPADAGFLMTYGPSAVLMIRRAAALYVSKILKGTPPAEIPVELPTKIDLVINESTSKALGLTIPPTLLVGAERITS